MPDSESRSTSIREWVTGLLLPLAIFLYTYQKDRSDEKQRELDRVTTVISSLGSNTEATRSLARSYIAYLAQQGEAPPEVVALLSNNAATASTPGESAAAVRTLQVVEQKNASLAPAVQQVVKDLPTRVYLQIRNENDRSTAQQVQKFLSRTGLNVPGIELLGVGPSSTEVRYFHSSDQKNAQIIAAELTAAGIPTAAKDAGLFTNLLKSNVPEKQVELWLAPDAKFTQAM